MSDNEKLEDKSKLKKSLLAGVLAGAVSLNVILPTAAASAEYFAERSNSDEPEALIVNELEEFNVDSVSNLVVFNEMMMPSSEVDGDDEEAAPPRRGGGGRASMAATQVTPEVPVTEYQRVTLAQLPIKNVEATSVNEEVARAVAEAIAAMVVVGGITITQAGDAISISIDNANIVKMLDIPDGVNISGMTTMAILNDDGTLTPIPTQIDVAGNIKVIVGFVGDVVLVPLNITANFTDIGFLVQHVQDEINRAAALNIVQGDGSGIFNPTATVTNQEAATMFLRTIGIPVDFATAMTTAREQGLLAAGTPAQAPMMRIEAAQLIVNALSATGMELRMTFSEAEALLEAFTDLDGLTDEEKIALAVTVQHGIFQGVGSGLMNPDETLQRSQVASLAVRLHSMLFEVQ